jgi:hypothetical protein
MQMNKFKIISSVAIEVRVTLPLYLNKHRAMETYEAAKV